jgi:hypothetical protein
VTDAAGTILSAPAYLQPLITPVFVRTPASQEVAAGGQVTLSAAVSGYPPPFTYEWRRGPAPMVTNIVAATNNFYTFTVANVVTSLVYRVVVKNLAALQPGIASVATITVQADSDNDGLPDGWEATHNLAANDPTDAALDSDGDLMPNWQEYVAGTDPQDPSSYLRIDILATGGGANISFGSISNKTYTLQHTDALASGVWIRLVDVPARTNNATETFFDPGYLSGRYYRVATPRPP